MLSINNVTVSYLRFRKLLNIKINVSILEVQKNFLSDLIYGIQRVSELQKMVLLTSKPYHLLRF